MPVYAQTYSYTASKTVIVCILAASANVHSGSRHYGSVCRNTNLTSIVSKVVMAAVEYKQADQYIKENTTETDEDKDGRCFGDEMTS
jgi:hypothetical protein